MRQVLIVDNEPSVAQDVRGPFERAGFEVIVAHDGPSGLSLAQRREPDLVVLDHGLPGMDGVAVCRALRRTSRVPIIMLTRKTDDADRLEAQDLAADGYACKPLQPREFVDRARVILRRVQAVRAKPKARRKRSRKAYRFGEITFDAVTGYCAAGGRSLSLTPAEKLVLHALLQHAGQAVSRSQLYNAAMPIVEGSTLRAIDVHIHNLRRKLEPDPSNPCYILTAIGVGYRFCSQQALGR